MVLPATQGRGHPTPATDAVISVLFFLEQPARKMGLQDHDVAMLFLRMLTTAIVGLISGTGVAIAMRWLPKQDSADNS